MSTIYLLKTWKLLYAVSVRRNARRIFALRPGFSEKYLHLINSRVLVKKCLLKILFSMVQCVTLQTGATLSSNFFSNPLSHNCAAKIVKEMFEKKESWKNPKRVKRNAVEILLHLSHGGIMRCLRFRDCGLVQDIIFKVRSVHKETLFLKSIQAYPLMFERKCLISEESEEKSFEPHPFKYLVQS